jgi:hypothetical protein
MGRRVEAVVGDAGIGSYVIALMISGRVCDGRPPERRR